jgi:lipopolysaccharide transport system permease protein
MANWRASREMVGLLVRHRRLAWVLARREIADRYAGQLLGAFWAVGHPLLQVAVFLFVFAYVFQVRVGAPGSGPADYALYLLSGLVPWLAVQETLTRSTVSVTGQASLVKQVVFPTEVLPVKVALAAICTQVIFLVGLLAYRMFGGHAVPWTFALVPLLLAVEGLGLAGLALALGAVGVFFRDLKDFVQVFSAVGLYLMPVAYQPDMVPAPFQYLLWANPFSYLAWCFQDACYYGRLEHPLAWAVLPVLAVVAFAIGARVFRALKPMFGGAL